VIFLKFDAEQNVSVELLEGIQRAEPKNSSEKKTPKPYVFYCVMTLSTLIFALVFAASEIFSMLFSEGYLGSSLMSRFFGADDISEMSFQEIMLNQSFSNLSYWNETEDVPSNSEPTLDNDIPGTDEDDPDHPDEEKHPSVKPDEEKRNDIYYYDESLIPSGASGIIPLDLSLRGYGLDYIYDQSSFEIPLTEDLKSVSVSTDISGGVYPIGAPLVLIVHTHGTEGFSPEGVGYYDPSKEIARSDDVEKNVVSLGKAISDILNESGISTVHCDVMHDAEGYTGSYSRSGDTIRSYLKKYPSIQYVIDVHRDAIVRSSGELVKPVVEFEGSAAAQIMLVVGTGKDAELCSNWKKNLALSQQLRAEMESTCQGISRPTCLRDSSYNQQYSAYSVLVEIGAAGNTHKEALTAAKIAANALAAIIKGE